jgi:hypothetical protein
MQILKASIPLQMTQHTPTHPQPAWQGPCSEEQKVGSSTHSPHITVRAWQTAPACLTAISGLLPAGFTTPPMQRTCSWAQPSHAALIRSQQDSPAQPLYGRFWIRQQQQQQQEAHCQPPDAAQAAALGGKGERACDR